MYQHFIIGIVKGVLYNLGVEGTIQVTLIMEENEKTGYPKMQITLTFMDKHNRNLA